MVREEKIVDEIRNVERSRAHARKLRFYPKCSEQTSKDFKAAVRRIDSRLAKMELKDLLEPIAIVQTRTSNN